MKKLSSTKACGLIRIELVNAKLADSFKLLILHENSRQNIKLILIRTIYFFSIFLQIFIFSYVSVMALNFMLFATRDPFSTN